MSDIISIAKKALLLGDPSVGKTSLIRKYVYDKFDDKYISTLGTKISQKRIILQHPEKEVKIDLNMMIWDMMGQKEFQMFHQTAYHGAQGALIVSDLTRRETLDNLTYWVSSLFNVTSEIPLVFIGNKNDLLEKLQFNEDDLTNVAMAFNAPTFLTSARTGENVEESFITLGKGIIQHQKIEL